MDILLVVICDHPNHGNEPPSLLCHACENAGGQQLFHPPLHHHDLVKCSNKALEFFRTLHTVLLTFSWVTVPVTTVPKDHKTNLLKCDEYQSLVPTNICNILPHQIDKKSDTSNNQNQLRVFNWLWESQLMRRRTRMPYFVFKLPITMNHYQLPITMNHYQLPITMSNYQ